MYRGFGHAELFCGFTHSRAIFYDVRGKFASAFLDISFQDITRSLSRYIRYLCNFGDDYAEIVRLLIKMVWTSHRWYGMLNP